MSTDKPEHKVIDRRLIAAGAHRPNLKNARTHAARDAAIRELPPSVHHHADYLLHIDANAVGDIEVKVAPRPSKANRSRSRNVANTSSAPCRSN